MNRMIFILRGKVGAFSCKDTHNNRINQLGYPAYQKENERSKAVPFLRKRVSIERKIALQYKKQRCRCNNHFCFCPPQFFAISPPWQSIKGANQRCNRAKSIANNVPYQIDRCRTVFSGVHHAYHNKKDKETRNRRQARKQPADDAARPGCQFS